MTIRSHSLQREYLREDRQQQQCGYTDPAREPRGRVVLGCVSSGLGRIRELGNCLFAVGAQFVLVSLETLLHILARLA